MSPIRKFVFAFSTMAIGLFVYHSQFLADFKHYGPVPWWEGNLLYLGVYGFYKYGSIVSMVFGGLMLIVLGVKQFVHFFRDFFKNHLYT